MSRRVSPRLLLRRSGAGLLALVLMVSLLSAMTTNVFAGAVNVYDFANVLNKSQVSNEASSLPYAMDIYTTNTFNGSQQQFASETNGKINQNNKVVMAIDVRNHYVYLDGRGVSLARNQYQDAANAFSSSFRSSQDYSGAAVAAIDVLRSNSNTGSSGYLPGGNSFGLSALCCIGLLVLAALAVFGIFRSRGRGAGFFNRGFNRGPVPPYDPYNQPYNQGPYPPNYQGPYPPNYNQGMNPLAAGGLGAAAGGLLGYELGKEQGEREEGGFDQGGNYGGDGGAGADFGGNNNGGDGGAGADFGGNNNGGGDWGGGGGGSDFGGGGGGDNGGGAGSNF